jgi:SAM-dependent methyltransferase
MAAWSDGYVTDVQYVNHFYPELAPGWLTFACLRQGVRAPRLGPGATYLELGCGQGFSVNLLAAANPGIDFWGIDFNPGHVANARRLAEAAGTSNATFEDLSFEQVLALPEGRLPKFDVVALHGVLSWISPENRALVVRILDRVLKPGGLAYVSYNSLPGWAPIIPLQRFMVEYVARHPGDLQVRAVESLKAALALIEGGALYFKTAPTLKAHIERALGRKPAYLVHEYLNAHMHPLFHADMAQELDAARLTFAASAAIADDQIHLAAPAALIPQIREASEETWRQTLLDFAGAKTFRSDIFVRGRNQMPPAERMARLQETRFTLLAPAASMSFAFRVPIGNLAGHPPVYRPIVEALAEGPRSYGEIAALPALAGIPENIVIQAITLLIGGRRIHPVSEAAEGAAAAAGLNRALFARLTYNEAPTHLASPLSGSGVSVDFDDVLALSAAAGQGVELMARGGRPVKKDGETLTDPSAIEAELARRLKAFNTEKLPLFRALGVV